MDRIERFLRSRSVASVAGQAGTVSGSPGAVLVPFCEVGGVPSVLFIRRSMSLRRHRGEMAFPGGRVDPTDAGAVAAAVRETVEELGVGESDIDLWGALDPLETVSGYALNPFTGWLRKTSGLRLSAGEVSAVITVPVAELCGGALYRNETRLIDGAFVTRPTYAYNGNVIWGATGRIVSQLIACLKEA